MKIPHTEQDRLHTTTPSKKTLSLTTFPIKTFITINEKADP